MGVGRHLDLIFNAQYYQNFDCTVPLTEDDVIQQPLVLPPVNQGDAPTNNDNGRFFAQDPRSGNGRDLEPHHPESEPEQQQLGDPGRLRLQPLQARRCRATRRSTSRRAPR